MLGNSETYNNHYRELDEIAERPSDDELVSRYLSGAPMQRSDFFDAVHILRARKARS